MPFSDKLIARSRRIARKSGLGHLVEPEIHKFPPRDFVVDNPMAEIYAAHDGRLAAKWDHYHGIYHRHLSHLRSEPVRFLEIGVSHGGSLQIWRQYFGPAATIYGIDIDPRCAAVNDPPSVNIMIGSQADPNFLRSVIARMGGLDVVVDDGSHVCSHLIVSFETLFPLLSVTRIYVAEDLHTNYWRGESEGGWKRRSTFVEFAKDIVDDIHGWWHKKPQRVKDAHKSVGSIHFYDSLVVIEKAPRLSPHAHPTGTPSF